MICLENTAFENSLVTDQNQVPKYEEQEEKDKKEGVHLSNSELRLRRISVFAGKLCEIWLFKATQRFLECLYEGKRSCKFDQKSKL